MTIRKKTVQTMLAGGLVLCILASGTFAWTSFYQQRVNRFGELLQPGVNLHDDFTKGPQKDVYVENNGTSAALVRVRIAEYLHFETGETYPVLAVDDQAGTGWQPHAAVQGCDFPAHRYYDWKLGGHKPYMPAAPSARALGSELTQDYTEPRDVGDTTEIVDYSAALRAAFTAEKNAQALADLTEYLAGSEENAARLQTAIEALPNAYMLSGIKQYEGQPMEEQTRFLNEVRLTLIPRQAITMTDWLVGTTYGTVCEQGPFWVLDQDGWAYWAQPLQPGQATGQLLQSVTYKGAAPFTMTYKLRVQLSAVSPDGPSLNQFMTLAKAGEGLTENGARLLLTTSGSFVQGTDGALYLNNGNNTFQKLLKNGDSYINYLLEQTICGGPDGVPGSADDIKPGDIFSLSSAEEMLPAGAGEADYTVRSIVTGTNGVGYIELAAEGFYLASGVPTAGQEGTYELAALAQGSRWLFYSVGADGYLGTGDDIPQTTLWAQAENGGWYKAMSDNTWLLVTGPGSSEAADENGQPLTDETKYVYVCAGEDQNFSAAQDNLPVTVGADSERYLKHAMPAPDGAVYYTRAGDDGLLGVAPDETRWPGPDGLIGTEDDRENRWLESFLPNEFSGKPGATLTADGLAWTVIAADEKGDLLLLTDKGVESMGARTSAQTGNYPYASTVWPGRAATFTDGLTNLKPYAMDAQLPVEGAYTAAELRAAKDGLSVCLETKQNTAAFVPSASDMNVYIYQNTALTPDQKAKILYNGSIYSIRSQVKHTNGITIYGAAVYSSDVSFDSSLSGLGTEPGAFVCYYDQWHSTAKYYPRMALWVRFE